MSQKKQHVGGGDPEQHVETIPCLSVGELYGEDEVFPTKEEEAEKSLSSTVGKGFLIWEILTNPISLATGYLVRKGVLFLGRLLRRNR